MTNKLARYTTAELQAELDKRKNANTGNDWYFAVDGEDNDCSCDEDCSCAESDYCRIWIVHKRFWHLNHHVDDGCIAAYVSMPRQFHECQESCFEFEGSYTKAKSILQQAGFTELVDFDCWSASIVQILTLHNGSYRVDLTADTPMLKAAILKAEKDGGNLKFASVDAYKQWMKKLAKKLLCHVEWTPGYGNGCSGFFIDTSLYLSLPEEPKPLDEDEDDN